MTLDELTKTTGEWLRGWGPNGDIVISSRIRLARNVAGYPFLSRATSTQRTELCRRISNVVAETPDWADGVVFDLHDSDELDRELLVERHLISRQHAGGEGHRAVSVSADETRSIMINEEDHLRIQSLRSGLQLEALWTDVNAVDDKLGEQLVFAYDEHFGFLTACPTNVGTGIRVSVMLHLPALKMTKEIERVARAARDLRLAVRGLYGEGTEAVGDLFQISNQTTLGKSEEEIINDLTRNVVPRIVDYERAARESLVNTRSYQLDDKIWRAYGVLCNARCIGSEEVHAYLSPIRMGIHLKRFDKIDIDTVNRLFLYTQPAHLQKMSGKKLEGEQRGIARAEYVRKQLGV